MFLIPFQIDSYFPNFFIFLITKDIFWLFPVLTKDPVIYGSLMHNGLISVLPVLYPMKYLAFTFSVFVIGKLIGCQYFFDIYILYIEGFLWLMKLHFSFLTSLTLTNSLVVFFMLHSSIAPISYLRKEYVLIG